MPSIENSAMSEQLTAICERAAATTGIEIVEVQLRGSGKSRLLRIYIDKPGGVSHADCQLISDQVGEILDSENVIPDDSYTLEVSSPGVDRPLSKQRDFERVLGQPVRIYLREPLAGQKSYEGKVSAAANETLDVELASGELVHIPLRQVQKANLKLQW